MGRMPPVGGSSGKLLHLKEHVDGRNDRLDTTVLSNWNLLGYTDTCLSLCRTKKAQSV